MGLFLLQFGVPVLSVLLGMLSLVFVVTDARKFRQARQHTLDFSPTMLRAEALEAARHAAEYDLPESAALCYQLEAFWNRCVDDEPAPLEIEIVGARPKHEPGPFMEELQSHMLEPIAEPEPEFDLDAFVRRTRARLRREGPSPLSGVVTKHTPATDRIADLYEKRIEDAVDAEVARHLCEHPALRRTWQPTGTMRRQWQLKGTDEDAYVLDALRKHGVKVGREGSTAHLVGPVSAVQAAEAEYRAGWAARRAKRR